MAARPPEPIGDIEALEYSLLAAVLQTPDCIAKVAPALVGYKFHDPVLDWFWNLVRTHYNKNNEVPDPATIRANMHILADDQRANVMVHFNAISQAPISTSPKSAAATLRKRSEQLLYAGTAEKLATLAHQGDMDGAKAVIVSTKMDIASRSAPKAHGLLRPEYRPDMAARIPTGFHAFDKVVKGLAVGENGLILATTGKGKSAVAINLGFACFSRRKRVLHIDTENGEHVTRARYVSRFTGIPVDNILNNSMSDVTRERYDTWVQRHHERIGKNLRVVYLDFFGSNLDEVKAVVAEEIRNGYKPDQIIFDSPDHVRREKKESTWVEFADLIIEAANIPRQYGCCQWITSQAGMEYEDKIISTRGAANTSEKMRMASIAFSINFQMDPETNRPKDDGSLSIFLGKSRNTKRGMNFPLECDLSRMIMECPEVYESPVGDDDA